MRDFEQGEEVVFGRKAGEKTRGRIVKVNATSYKVEQLESRGTMRDYPVGTVWRVHKSLVSEPEGGAPRATASVSAVPALTFKRGEVVEFDHHSKGLIFGVVERVNAKTVTLKNTNVGSGWRVSPGLLRRSTRKVVAAA